MRAGTCLCQGVPAMGSHQVRSVRVFRATPVRSVVAVLGGQVEAGAVGQGRVSWSQAVVDLDDRLSGAVCRGDLGEGAVGQAELLGVVRADA